MREENSREEKIELEKEKKVRSRKERKAEAKEKRQRGRESGNQRSQSGIITLCHVSMHDVNDFRTRTSNYNLVFQPYAIQFVVLYRMIFTELSMISLSLSRAVCVIDMSETALPRKKN